MEEGAAKLFDAVVHFAAVPRYGMVPDTETYRVNTVGTYNVLEAALKMGIRKVIIASSETTYGVCFSDGVVEHVVLPGHKMVREESRVVVQHDDLAAEADAKR